MKMITSQLKGFELYGRILSLTVEVEAMKVANDVRMMVDESPAYHEEDFQVVRKEMDVLVKSIADIRR